MTKRAKHVALSSSCRTRPNTAVRKKRGYYKGTARRHLKSLISKPKKLVLDFKIGDVARFHRFGRGGEGGAAGIVLYTLVLGNGDLTVSLPTVVYF